MGELRVGDEVYGSDGKPTAVVGVFPQGLRPTYRFAFSDGSTLDADDQHIWAVRTPSQKIHGAGFSLMTTEEIRAKPLTHSNGNRQRFIPMTAPLQYRPGDFPLDPYVLGVLLGDGSLVRSVCWAKPDDWLAQEVTRLLPSGVSVRQTEKREGRCPSYSVTALPGHRNAVLDAVRAMGLLGSVSYTKFIPEPYFYGSVEQRQALLQGLLDTDGYVSPRDNNIEFSSASEDLSRGVSRLVQSLGGTARVRIKKEPTYTHNGVKKIGRPSYRISIALPVSVAPFRTPVKANVYQPRKKYQPSRSIVSIEPLGEQETVCIKVAAEDGLFVAGTDYIVTHNTVMSISCIEQLHDDGQVDAGLVIAQSDLKYQWAEKIEEFTKGTAASIVIDGTPARRAKQYDQALTGDYRYVIVNYEQVVNDWERVRRLPRDYLIADEVTALKGFRSQRSKRVKRLNAPYVYGLTGDPMENGRLEEVYSIMQFVDDRVLGRYDLFDKTFIVRNPFGGVSRYRNVEAFRTQMVGHWSRRTQDDPEVAPYLPKVMPPKNHYVTLDTAAAKLYRRISQELQADLAEAAGKMGGSFDIFSHYGGGQMTGEQNALRGKIMSKTQALQMLCDHPELLRHSARLYRQTEASGGSGGSAYAAELDSHGLLEPLTKTPKQDVALRLINDVLEDECSKVVLFSHDVPTLDYLEKALKHGAVQYHGGMNAKQKEASKKRFQQLSEVRVLLSSDAGGYGVDLPQGNHVVNFDLPWSSGALKQRNSRIIRASSTFKRVYLHNVLVKDSVDEWQYGKLAGKFAVGNAFLDGRGLDSKGGLALDVESLTRFLRERSP